MPRLAALCGRDILAAGDALTAELSQHPKRLAYMFSLLKDFFVEWHKQLGAQARRKHRS